MERHAYMENGTMDDLFEKQLGNKVLKFISKSLRFPDQAKISIYTFNQGFDGETGEPSGPAKVTGELYTDELYLGFKAEIPAKLCFDEKAIDGT